MVNRKRSSLVDKGDLELLPVIEGIKCKHPFWGYRRVWATLKYRYGFVVNAKRIFRIMREHGLTVNRVCYKAKRTGNRSKPKPTRPNEWWGIDMTKIMTASGWAYLVIVLDWYTKKIVGWDCNYKSQATDWLCALDMGLNSQFPYGAHTKGLHLMSDNGCQPTSVRFMADCALLGVNQTFTSYNNPKGNADTERMMRTIKEELVWINEYVDLWDLKKALKIWIDEYNNDYLHSALGYKSPTQFENQTLLIYA